jgi:hypothetical protein
VLVGVHGYAGAGKDTVGEWFVRERGAWRAWFAWPIKAALCEMFALPADVWTRERKEVPLPGLGRSPRELAQTLGTEWGRALVHPDVWVIACERGLRAAGVLGTDRPIVIPDTRFPNEAKWIRAQGGFVLHVIRPGHLGVVGISGHASEAGLPVEAGDVVVRNDGTIADLYAKLGALFAA